MSTSSHTPQRSSWFVSLSSLALLLFALGGAPWACTAPASTEETTADAASTTEKEPEKPKNCTASPSKPCLTGCGNAFGVGMPCSKGNGECNDNKKAILCTIDFSETDLHFCTFPCVVDEDCGEGAICQGDPEKPKSGRGCFPLTCGGHPEPTAENTASETNQEASTDAGEATPVD
ncbi:MAG: hypothetical protein H6728_00135 [Myxococcales bacterium]|nr:hypothetical protein [Myxococcales bacterium]MCB9641470.1 hypothetical protein [Myxococcales bacterium]